MRSDNILANINSSAVGASMISHTHRPDATEHDAAQHDEFHIFRNDSNKSPAVHIRVQVQPHAIQAANTFRFL